MRNRSLLVFSTFACLLGGCSSGGISVRDPHGQEYPNFVQSLVESQTDIAEALTPGASMLNLAAASVPSSQPAPLHLPMKLAIAQAGEVAPPDSMLQHLRKAN